MISIICIFYIYTNTDNIENNTQNCCGGVMPGVHFNETDPDPPFMISRCIKENTWNGRPCITNGKNECCGEYGTCFPTTKGGICSNKTKTSEKKSNAYTADGNKISPGNVGGFIDVTDTSSVGVGGDNVDIVLSGRELYQKNLAERRKRLRDSQYTPLDVVFNYNNYRMEIYETYSVIMWIYFIHIFIILFLVYIFRNRIDQAITQYFESYFNLHKFQIILVAFEWNCQVRFVM